VLAARDEGRGRAALESVRNDAAAGSEVLFHQLDITDGASVAAFAGWARSELHSINVLCNNAGFAYKGNAFGADEAEETIGVNFRGTAAVTEALLPFIPDGRQGEGRRSACRPAPGWPMANTSITASVFSRAPYSPHPPPPSPRRPHHQHWIQCVVVWERGRDQECCRVWRLHAWHPAQALAA
jgi:NAD(P)-dependent dehydrogenase (short-subunit alcohol dehydrogenase family)